METTGPIDSNIALVAVQSRSTFHTTTRTNSAELKKPVENWTIVSNVVSTLFFGEVIHIVRCHLGEEVDIFIGVELGHLIL